MHGQRTFKGTFKPENPKKYVGDVNQIVYRSSWERKFMTYLDRTNSVISWCSEEIIVHYIGIDKRQHRYFPDFVFTKKNEDGTLEKIMVEIKPHAQCLPPKGERKTKRLIEEILTYQTNQEKWKAAREFCAKNKMKFVILTEKMVPFT